MIFNSVDFLLFFPVVYALYFYAKLRMQNVILLAASYFFYGYWDPRFLSLLVISTIVDYFASIKIEEHRENHSRAKLYLYLSICSNLGILGFFKYFNFFAGSTKELLQVFGFHPDFATLTIILPMGISFYTFQTMSYTIDVYRGEIKPERNFLDFALFVTFFPQLVAGPIERAKDLLPQIIKERTITFDKIKEGSFLILLGYFKKIYIADNLSGLVDPIFNPNANVSGADALLGACMFYIQIYGDFSGYSDIARGIARYMGFDLMVNFNHPMLSVNPSDFWRRWHISLMNWLRDYIYIPLGGRNVSVFRQHVNSLIVFVLSGLWHGASWHFVAWGFVCGAVSSGHRVMYDTLKKMNWKMTEKQDAFTKPIRIFSTFIIIACTTFFFRAESLPHAANMLLSIFTDFGVMNMKIFGKFFKIAWLLVAVEIYQYLKNSDVSFLKAALPVRALVYFLLFYCVLILGNCNKNAFIYFVF